VTISRESEAISESLQRGTRPRRCLEVGRNVRADVLVYDSRFLDHVVSPSHVERPDRLRAIVERLKEEHLYAGVEAATPATREEVEAVHRSTYVEHVRNLGDGFLDPETVVHPETFEIASLAAGAVLGAARAAVRDGRPTVALVRPPGHHAGPDYGGGFCYLNNVAVAAADCTASGHRVAILDYDAHHGNGTRDIFAASASVLYVSTHEYGIYPGTGPAEDVGEGDGRGFTVNVPLSAGCGDASFLTADEVIIEPILEGFRPDVVLMSLGVDAHYRDPLTSLTLSSPGYVELVSRAAKASSRLCGNRLAIALEGGYHLDALAEVLVGVVGRLQGRTVDLALTEVFDDNVRGRAAIEATKRAHGAYWNLR